MGLSASAPTATADLPAATTGRPTAAVGVRRAGTLNRLASCHPEFRPVKACSWLNAASFT